MAISINEASVLLLDLLLDFIVIDQARLGSALLSAIFWLDLHAVVLFCKDRLALCGACAILKRHRMLMCSCWQIGPLIILLKSYIRRLALIENLL